MLGRHVYRVSPTPNGVCGSTHRLQIHHLIAVAKGGKTTLDNLRLACQNHNLLYARPDATHEELSLKGKRDPVAAYWIPP